MKAMVIKGSFGIENLEIVEREIPTPGPGQVLLKMKAMSLNYRDLLMIRGHYNPKQPLPLIPNSDGVGVVESIGDSVTRAKVGDRVCPIFCQKWREGAPTHKQLRSTLGGPLDGTLAEFMVIDEEGLVHPPAHLTDVECATLPCAGVTAWTALFTEGGLQQDSSVLLLGTGGVSVFGLQFAKAAGAHVIMTSSSDEKLARVKELGADEVINYKRDENWSKTVRKLTNGAGVDHVVEVGGAGTLEQSIKASAIGGHIALIGVLSGNTSKVNVTRIFMNYLRLQGILVGHRESFEAMNSFIHEKDLRPVVDRVFPFEKAREAFELMASTNHLGKISVSLEG